MRPELIVGGIVLLAGTIGLGLTRKWLIKAVREKGYNGVSTPSSAGAKKHGASDPLAKADVYLAYGRKRQALETLKQALQEHPSRSDIEAKLRKLIGGDA